MKVRNQGGIFPILKQRLIMPVNKKIKRNNFKLGVVNYCLFAIFCAYFSVPLLAKAESGWKLEVPLPGLGGGKSVDIANYVIKIYNIAGGIVGIVGVLMFMIGGFQYMIAAGKKDMSSEAKKSMINAIIGIALVLTARVVLGTINKELIDLQSLNLGGGNQ